MPHEDTIMHILRMHAGQIVPIHRVASIISTNVLNPMRNQRVSRRDRARVRSEVFRTVTVLAQQKKIKNYRHARPRRGILHAGIRINEAFV